MNFNELFQFDTEQLSELVITYGIQILTALVIFVVGRWIAKAITGVLRKTLTRANADDMLVGFLGNIAYGLLLTFVIIAALSQLGIETTSLAAILAAAGLAVGLALQGSLSNFAAGVMIVIFRPFRKGDYIEAAGTAGSVDDINIFTTTLKTPDNKTVIIPNSGVTGGNITNYSAEPKRRVDLVFGIGYNDDLKKAKKVLESIVTSDERVLKDPAPLVAVDELADSSVNFIVRPWVNTADYWGVYWDMTEKVKETFDEEGISIPFPQQDVYMHDVVAMKKAAA